MARINWTDADRKFNRMRPSMARINWTDKPFNRLKASIAPLIGHHPCAKIFVILTTA